MRGSLRITAALVACIAVIGVIDYVTGPDIGLSLFYLVPIIWSAWRTRQSTAIAVAICASVSWLAADAAWHGLNAVSIWNGVTRFGIYVSMAALTSRVRRDQRRLRDANARLQEVLKYEQNLARTDALTSLWNRRLFVDELRRAAARSHRNNAPLAVAYLDLDQFKSLNDRSGHTTGDALLRAIGDVLRATVRGTDVAARLGGDEFGILLEQCTPYTAHAMATRLLQELSVPLEQIANGSVGISIGVACFNSPPLSPDALIAHADAAMYSAKAQGRNRICLTEIVAEAVADDRRYPLEPRSVGTNLTM